MSNRYLFKARTDNGEWVEGYPIIDECGYFIMPEDYISERQLKNKNYGYELILIKAFEVDPSTLCQCTGLTDKKGRKIWEGDILSAHLDDSYPDDVTYVEIKWNGFSWCTRESIEDDVMTEYDCNTFEVCGNIFDNSEIIPNYWKAVQNEN